MGGKQHKKKPSFELWRDRTFSILVPLLLGYLLISGETSQQIRTLIIVLLVGFATGQATILLRALAKGIGAGILEMHHQSKKDKQSKDDQTNKDGNTNNDSKSD